MKKKQKWSNKEIARRIVAPILFVAVFTAVAIGVFTVLNKPTGVNFSTNDKFSSKGSVTSEQIQEGQISKFGTTVVGIGTPITLSVEQDKETEGKFGYTAGFPWESGSMRLTVDQAQSYASVTDAEIDPAECAYLPEENTPFVLLQITLENVDAQLYDEMNFSIGSLISAEAFEGKNVQNGNFLSVEPIYFSEHRNSSEDSRDYFHGELNPGSSKTFQLGFLVYEPQKELALKLGSNGDNHKYGVTLGLTL